MPNFIDMLGNPISVGALIAYPTAVGSSSAEMNLAEVESLDEIIKLPSGDWTLHSYRNRANPTMYRPIGRNDWDPVTRTHGEWIPERGRNYVARVWKLDDKYYSYSKPRLTILKNVNRIIVISKIVNDDLMRDIEQRRDQRQKALDGLL